MPVSRRSRLSIQVRWNLNRNKKNGPFDIVQAFESTRALPLDVVTDENLLLERRVIQIGSDRIVSIELEVYCWNVAEEVAIASGQPIGHLCAAAIQAFPDEEPGDALYSWLLGRFKADALPVKSSPLLH
jgi:hypothetical protein